MGDFGLVYILCSGKKKKKNYVVRESGENLWSRVIADHTKVTAFRWDLLLFFCASSDGWAL